MEVTSAVPQYFTTFQSNTSQIIYNGPSMIMKIIPWTTATSVFIMNIIVLIVIPQVQSLNKTSTGAAMMSLAVADGGVGLSALVSLLYDQLTGTVSMDSTKFMCKLTAFCITCFSLSSILTLTAINLDRYLTLAYPLRYSIFMDMKKIVASLMLLWMLAFIMILPPMFSRGSLDVHYYVTMNSCLINMKIAPKSYSYSLFSFSMLLPTIIISYSFGGIFHIAHKQSIRINVNGEQQRGWMSSHDAKIIRTLLIMTVGFYILWTPYNICSFMWEVITGHTLHPLMDFISIISAATNSIINPIIYVPTIKPYRQRLALMFHIHK